MLKWVMVTQKINSRMASNDESGMETDQEEQLDALLNQPAKVIDRNQGAEESDSSTNSERDNRSTSQLDN